MHENQRIINWSTIVILNVTRLRPYQKIVDLAPPPKKKHLQNETVPQMNNPEELLQNKEYTRNS